MNASLLPHRAAREPLDLEPVLALLFVLIDERRAIVLHVTASGHGEGTTTVAREIAAAAAASGWCKVALLDGDTTGRVTEPGASPAVGLIETFEGGGPLVLRPGHVQAAPIAVGSLGTPGRAVTKLESARGVYAALRARYNLVVVDGAPVFSGQQGAVLASAADATVLVVEAERSNVDTVVRARKALEQLGTRVLGVVLNKGRRRVPRFIGRWL